jgi:hypothetical protein
VRAVKPGLLYAIGAAVFMLVPAVATGSAQASPSPSSNVPADQAAPRISERRCNVGERPKQIVLFLGIGGEDGQRCFGGTIGSINLGRAPVYDLYSGGYTGAIDCVNRFHQFRPEQVVTIIDVCTTLTILPGS